MMTALGRLAITKTTNPSPRSLFHWVNLQFNIVDEERRKLVGPDRACAEWLLRNGAAVKFSNEATLMKDYNDLPDEKIKVSLTEVDATGSSIMHNGFEHFKGCTKVKKVILSQCLYLEDRALIGLEYLKNSLEYLHISSCKNISEEGLMHCHNLVNLKQLILFDLPLVQKKEKIASVLKSSLPKTDISFLL